MIPRRIGPRDDRVGLGDLEGVAGVAEGVVVVEPTAAGDRVGPDVAELAGRRRAGRLDVEDGRVVGSLEGTVDEGERRVDLAVDLGLGVSGDGQGGLGDLEGVAGVAEGVVVVEPTAAGDRVGPDVAELAGRRRAGRLDVEDGRVVGSLEGTVDEGERRVDLAVDLGLGVSGDGQGRLGDLEGVAGVAEGVVVVEPTAAGDRVGPDVAELAGRRRAGRLDVEDGRVVGSLEGTVDEGERRVDLAVDLGLGVSGDGQGRLGDLEGVAGVAEGVVVVEPTAAGDRVGPDVAELAGRRRAGRLDVEDGRVVGSLEGTVDEGERRVDLAVDLGLGVSGDGQGRLGDLEGVAGVAEGVVVVEPTAAGDRVGPDVAELAGRRRAGRLDVEDGRVVGSLEGTVDEGERRVDLAVDLGLGVSGDGQGRPG